MACSTCGGIKVNNDVQIKAEVKKVSEIVPLAKMKIIVKEIKNVAK